MARLETSRRDVRLKKTDEESATKIWAHRLNAGKKRVMIMGQRTSKPMRPDWPTAWTSARERLRRELGDAVFDAWIGPLTLEAWENDELNIGAAKPFVRNWVANHYVARIERTLKAEGAEPASISIVLTAPKPMVGGGLVRESARVEPPPMNYGVRPQEEEAPNEGGRGLWTRMLHPQQTFDSFIAGPANEFGLGAARAFLMVSGTLNRATDEIAKIRSALGNRCVGVFDKMPPSQ